MRNFKLISSMLAVIALVIGFSTVELMACTQPFDVINDTPQNITKIEIEYCDGTVHTITGTGAGPTVKTVMIPCGPICNIRVEVNGVLDSTLSLPHWGPTPAFPSGVLADQAHVHFFL